MSLPTLAVNPSSLLFATTGLVDPSSQVVNVSNSGDGTLSFAVTSDSPWLSASPAGGTAPQTVAISIDLTLLDLSFASGISAGTNAPYPSRLQLRLSDTTRVFTGSLTVLGRFTGGSPPTTEIALGSPQTVTFTLVVRNPAIPALPIFGPFEQTSAGSPPITGPLGNFDPRRDLDVYVDGNLVPVQASSFDAPNNRYLLNMGGAFNLNGTIQVVHHITSPAFVGGVGAFPAGVSASGSSTAVFPAATSGVSFVSPPTSGVLGAPAMFTVSVVNDAISTSAHSGGLGYVAGDTGYIVGGNNGAFYRVDSVFVPSSVSLNNSDVESSSGAAPVSVFLTGLGAPTSGDLLVVTIYYTTINSNFEPTTRTVADNVGNMWHEAVHIYNPSGVPIGGIYTAGEGVSVWACLSALPSNPTITATLSGAAQSYKQVFVTYEDYTGITVTGVNSTSAGYFGFDNVSNTATPTIPSFSTTGTTFILAAFASSGNGTLINPYTASGGFTKSFGAQQNFWGGVTEYRQNAPASTYSLSITSINSLYDWVYAAVAFTSVGLGAVLTHHLTSYGNGYSSAMNVATADSGPQPGIGSGFTVDISPAAVPTGNVVFSDTGVVLGTVPLMAVGSPPAIEASIVAPSLGYGLHEIRADYQGSGTLAASYAAVPFVVNSTSGGQAVGGFAVQASFSPTADEL